MLAVFLNAYLGSNNSGLSSIPYFKKQDPVSKSSSLIFFSGLLNAFFTCINFYSSYYILMPTTALLICLENTFWTGQRIGRGNKFVKLFKKSFKLYVQSGTRKKMEAAINILINEQGGGCLETEDFKAKFLMLITEHYLRKNSFVFYYYLHLY